MITLGTAPATLHDRLWRDPEIDILFEPQAEIRALLRYESALAQAQAKCGFVKSEAAKTIGQLCASFSPDLPSLATGIARDGVVIPELIRQLQLSLPKDIRSSLHMRSTSQDAIDTAMVMALAIAIGKLKARISETLALLMRLEERFGQIPQMARTRMQRALPTRASARIAAWCEPIVRHIARIDQMMPRLLVVQCGGPVGAEMEPWLPELARLLELGVPTRGWQTARDNLSEFASWLSLVSGSAGKIGIDIAMMAQSEIGEVEFANGGRSSAMAHKSNPVSAEILVAIARFNANQLGCFHQALVHEQERSGAAWTLEWMVLPRMLSATGASLNHLNKLLSDISFKPSITSGS